ncbi:Leucine Rich repeat-containing domain protein [Aphelenchoides besseyi]|nr:Leucine Rich repeat-containing domain protein [Aphelenchoides besseyi]
MFEGLRSLKELDVSHNNLSQIDNQTFSSVAKTLRVLNLSGNKLKTLNVDVIRDLNLTELNIGDNPWLCDRKLFESKWQFTSIQKLLVVNWIKKQYSDGAKNSREFLLANAANTTCHRPYSLQGRNVMELKDSEVPFVYDYDIDTTTALQPTETTTSDPNDNSTINIFDLSKLSINVGESNDTFEVNVDEGKPIYDINSIRYGQRPVKNSTNTWVSVVVVSLLLILTATGVVLVVRRKKAHVLRTNSTNSQRVTSSNF